MRSNVSCGISRNFSRLFPTKGQITHALLTRPPLSSGQTLPEGIIRPSSARLACVRHAASVHPEPGSNSLLKFILNQYSGLFSPMFLQIALRKIYSCLQSSRNYSAVCGILHLYRYAQLYLHHVTFSHENHTTTLYAPITIYSIKSSGLFGLFSFLIIQLSWLDVILIYC